MRYKPLAIAALVLATNELLLAIRLKGLIAYFVPSLAWFIVALVSLWAIGFHNFKSSYSKSITFIAIAVAIAQTFITIDAGLFLGFGKSPYSFTPMGIIINIIFVSTQLIGLEFSRFYLIKIYGRKKPFLSLILITLFYTNVFTPFTNFISIITRLNDSLLPLVDFIGANFIPTLTENLFVSYLSFIGGPIASIAYRGPLLAAEWFIPVLPDLTWGYKTLLGVLPPVLGFLYLTQIITQRDLRRIGIFSRETMKNGKKEKNAQSPQMGWAILSIIGIIMIWFSTGLLGVYPTVPISGSMRPTIDVGDMAIIIKTSPDAIKVNDIVEFWRDNEIIIHRVCEIKTGNSKLFITKGDNNRIPDFDPVFPGQIRGKLLYTIPKIGWISIYLKVYVSNFLSLISNNIKIQYSIIISMITILLIYTYRYNKNSLLKRWMKRGW